MPKATNKRSRSHSGARPTSTKKPEPDGQIRASQLITTYGPGALVDLVHDAVVVGGLERWRYGQRENVLRESRLRDHLLATIPQLQLREDAPFREPPTASGPEASRNQGIDVIELPRWFVCMNPRCRALKRSDVLERKQDRYFHLCDDAPKVNPGCVPVRFVAACRRGHLDEFPWNAFVHGRGARCLAPRFTLDEGKTGDFVEVRVSCACGAARRLIEASVPDANPPCSGKRPWLGADAEEACTERTHLLVRTASNGYFAQVASVISIPDPGQALRELVEKHWDKLANVDAHSLPMLRSVIDGLKRDLSGYQDAEVLAIVAAVKSKTPTPREPLKVAEYRQLWDAPREDVHESPGPDTLFFPRGIDVPRSLSGFVGRVVLVKKMQVVQAQVGFTRIEPPAPAVLEELDLGVELAPLSLGADWLPATRFRAEGIFVELDRARLEAWERRPEVIARGRALLAGHRHWAERRKEMYGAKASVPPFPGLRFYLIHSLSHLLMNALSLECGYPAASLKERLYAASPEAGPGMAAFLISTGTSGSAGTLGGLVEEGRRLDAHLSRAIQEAQLCSYDPVCASHTPAQDLAERYLEGAACHGCMFVAECSCERSNQYLDRALVAPTIGLSGVAYFEGWR